MKNIALALVVFGFNISIATAETPNSTPLPLITGWSGASVQTPMRSDPGGANIEQMMARVDRLRAEIEDLEHRAELIEAVILRYCGSMLFPTCR